MNAADSSSVLDGESHVAFLAPAGAPGVLHDPVLLPVLRAVANEQGGVVERGSTLGRVENTAGVLLENCLISLKRDRDWLFFEGAFHGVRVLLKAKHVAFDFDAGCLGRVIAASAVCASVRVVGFCLRVVGLPVVEGVVLQASVAPVIAPLASSAVNQLLL